MKHPIVSSDEPIALIGGGVLGEGDIAEVMALSSMLVAVDGGLGPALRAGVMPAAVIGDFDSLDPDDAAQIPANRLHKIAEQDSTDFDKALRHVAAPVVLAVGFTGARLDHQLAGLHSLVARAEQPCIIVGAHEVMCLAPPQLDLPLAAGDVVSLMPFGPVGGRSTGLAWPIDGLAFDPMTKIGTSNQATGPVQLGFDAPCMILMIPRRALGPLTQALAALPASGRWPAP